MTELYIEGQRMDLSPDTIIARTFQQNLLSSQGTVDSPYTNSFTLPYTRGNAEKLGNPHEPTSMTPTPYIKLDTVIRQDGIEQFPSSIAEVQGFDAGFYNVQVFAGAVPFFDLLGDKKLQDLDFTEHTHIWNYANVVANLDGQNGVFVYEVIDRGKPLNLSRLHPVDLMPSVFAKAIWDRIFSGLGVGYEMEPHADFEALTVPFTNDKPVHRLYGYLDIPPMEGPDGSIIPGYQLPLPHWLQGRQFSYVITPEGIDPLAYQVTDFGVLRVDFRMVVHSMPKNADNSNSLARFSVQLDMNGTAAKAGVVIERAEFSISAPGVYEFSKTFSIEYGTDLSKLLIRTEVIGFKTSGFQVGKAPGTFPTYGTYSDAFTLVTYNEDVYFGTEWDLSLNLPDMTQRDFILAMCKLFGWSLVYDPYTGNILVKPLENVARNLGIAPDWSAKVTDSFPKAAFKLPDTARRNLYKWKEDETVPAGHGDGFIEASNEHLEEERTAVEMVFAASQERNGLLLIPMNKIKVNNPTGDFSAEKNSYPELLAMGDPADGTRVFVRDATGDPTVIRGWAVYENKLNVWIKREREDDYDSQSVEPRLALRTGTAVAFTVSDGTSSTSALAPVPLFSQLSFRDRILKRYHHVTQRILARVQLLNVPVLLTAQEFAELDSTVPVWVDRYRDYYYINKVSDYTSEAIPCEAELIKLN